MWTKLNNEKLLDTIRRAAGYQVGIESYDPDTEWSYIEESKFLDSPFKHIGLVCRINTQGEKVEYLGTGWRSDSGLVVTAAHVVAGREIGSVKCFFNDGTTASYLSESDFPQEFIDEYGEGRVGSIFDIAIMHMDDEAFESGGLEIQFDEFNVDSSCLCPGYLSGLLVSHEASLSKVSDGNYKHIIHTAPTDHGHSGAPLLQNGMVIGLHVGRITILDSEYPDEGYHAGPYDNLAIAINQSIFDELA